MACSPQNKIFIFNGYPELSRKNFDLSDVGHPHDLLGAALLRHD
jgi:hypothetical protein